MGRKKVNYKVGETVSFRFAGTVESGSIVRVDGSGRDTRYWAYDGSYTYPFRKDDIV